MPPTASHPATTSTSLLLRLRHQEPEAWRYFEIVYMPYVARCCKRLPIEVRDQLQFADQEDVARDVFLKVRRKIGDFNRQRDGSFRSWLRVITYRLALDYCKAKQINILVDDLDRFTKPTPGETDEETLFFYETLVTAAANKYSAKWLRCFLGMTVFGLTSKELAAELDMSEGAVRKANFKILHWLRTEFADLLADPSE